MVIKLRLTKEQDEKRKKLVLKIFQKSGPLIAQTDIVEATGWHKKTVGKYLNKLVKEKKIAVYKTYSTLVLYRLAKRKDLKFKLYKLKK